MGAQRVLFLDDRSNRIHSAIRCYCLPAYELCIVTTAKECIKKLNDEQWDVVSLDHDLDFGEFVDSRRSNCGMAVVRWLIEAKHHMSFWHTEFIIHSTNEPAGRKMVAVLQDDSKIPSVHYLPWEYPKYYKSVISGAFDVIHPGYIKLFEMAKALSSHLTIALNVSPEGKPSPVLSADDREERLWAIRYVDDVQRYETEEELTKILTVLNRDNSLVRVMGDDHKGKSARSDLGIPVHYMERYGDWSATKLKKMYGGQHE